MKIEDLTPRRPYFCQIGAHEYLVEVQKLDFDTSGSEHEVEVIVLNYVPAINDEDLFSRLAKKQSPGDVITVDVRFMSEESENMPFHEIARDHFLGIYLVQINAKITPVESTLKGMTQRFKIEGRREIFVCKEAGDWGFRIVDIEY